MKMRRLSANFSPWGLWLIYLIFAFVSLSVSVKHHHSHQRLHANRAVLEVSNLETRSNLDIAISSVPTERQGQLGGNRITSFADDFTCGPGKACSNGACCGKDGWCGYNGTYCGEGCQSNCDAKAECGQFASPSGKGCPLNVCCSSYGFCGTSSLFCSDGCQSHCTQPNPLVSEQTPPKKVIAYWESWNSDHLCGTMSPADIPIDQLTHLFMAFGYITPGDFKVTNMPGVDTDLYAQIPQLKSQSPSLKVSIALGGWTFNDPGTFQNVFGDLASSASNRRIFINNLLGFLSEYGFDGVDFDWEYPGADDRGGNPDDGENYTLLLKELRDEIDVRGNVVLVTFTAPTSYWYLRHFDLKAMTEYADWIQLMSYDLHGVWDSLNPIGSVVAAHTNITEIDLALDLFWRNEISPDKVVLGLGFYGRSFQLADTACWKPGCLFTGPGSKGPCTNAPGILSYKEITDIITSTGARAFYDETAQVNYMVYGGNNWISFDDKNSFQAKIRYAYKLGLSGVMIWAIDQDNSNNEAIESISSIHADMDHLKSRRNSDSLTGPENAISHDTLSPSQCYVTKCYDTCHPNSRTMTRVSVSSTDDMQCPGQRYVCCPSWSAPDSSQCHWADKRTGLFHGDCAGLCDNGEVKIAGDNHGWEGSLETGKPGAVCTRGGVSYCCKAGNLDEYLKICSWTSCGGDCASESPDKLYELTTDVGGPNNVCPILKNKVHKQRTLCCPENTFEKPDCTWRGRWECSEACADSEVQIDSDGLQGGGQDFACYRGRQALFCCVPPGGLTNPFLPVSLNRIFPDVYLPAPQAVPKFNLVNWRAKDGPDAEDNPRTDNIAFFLIAGDSYAVSHLRKRDDQPEPFLFLECPVGVLDRQDDHTQVVRVACFSSDVNGCFKVRERGVEGTIVEMPDNCGGGSWARAISLTISKNQIVPYSLKHKNPTSAIFDFTFDYNIKNMRRDAGPTSIRIDYSNAMDYWDSVVDSDDGVQGGSALQEDTLGARYFTPNTSGWKKKFSQLTFDPEAAVAVSRNVEQLVFWETQTSCPLPSCQASYTEGLGAGIRGSVDVKLHFGFSLIATIEAEKLIVHQSAGFLRAEGSTDLNFEIIGAGNIDISKLFLGNPASKNTTEELPGHKLFKGWLKLAPWFQTTVSMGTKGSNDSDPEVEFYGRANLRVKSDFGHFNAYFPDGDFASNCDPSSEGCNPKQSKDSFQSSTDNVLYSSGGNGTVLLGHSVGFGLDVTLNLPDDIGRGDGNFPGMSVTKSTFANFIIYQDGPPGTSCLDYSVQTLIDQAAKNQNSVGWNNYPQVGVQLSNVALKATTGMCFLDIFPPFQNSKDDESGLAVRQGPRLCGGGNLDITPGFNAQFRQALELGNAAAGGVRAMEGGHAGFDNPGDATMRLRGNKCYNCYQEKTSENEDEDEDDEKLEGCCSCGCTDQLLGEGDIPCGRHPCQFLDGTWPGPGVGHTTLAKRVSGKATLTPKDISVCPPEFSGEKVRGASYPSFPKDQTFPWDHIQGDKWEDIDAYYGNASSDCADWTVVRGRADQRTLSIATEGYAAGSVVRADYNTEHVFEGQIIGDFFGKWLINGKVKKQDPLFSPATAQPLQTCEWVNENIKSASLKWSQGAPNRGKPSSLIRLLLEELGTTKNLHLLTIYLQRPNLFKGAMFSLNSPSGVDTPAWASMGPDLQLQRTKEWAMNFNYLNLPEVWDKFCQTYNAMRFWLIAFDSNWNDDNGPPPKLVKNWDTYIRVLLDTIVIDSRANLEQAFITRAQVPNSDPRKLFYDARWAVNMFYNKKSMKLNGTCINLAYTNVTNI